MAERLTDDRVAEIIAALQGSPDYGPVSQVELYALSLAVEVRDARASRVSPPPDLEARRLDRAEVERLLGDDCTDAGEVVEVIAPVPDPEARLRAFAERHLADEFTFSYVTDVGKSPGRACCQWWSSGRKDWIVVYADSLSACLDAAEAAEREEKGAGHGESCSARSRHFPASRSGGLQSLDAAASYDGDSPTVRHTRQMHQQGREARIGAAPLRDRQVVGPGQGEAMTRAKRFAPDLSALMAEQKLFFDGDAVSDRARAQFHALMCLAVAVTGREAVSPDNCWGYDIKTRTCRCQVHRAIDRLRNVAKGGTDR